MCELVNPRALVTNAKIDNVNKIVPLFEKQIQPQEPVLVIGDNMGRNTLLALMVNTIRGVLNMAAIQASGFE